MDEVTIQKIAAEVARHLPGTVWMLFSSKPCSWLRRRLQAHFLVSILVEDQ
jgi:hypothetical protein